MGYCEKICGKYGEWLYLVFRVLVGLMFFLHGWGKIFGEQPATGIFMVAGIIELVVGAGVFLGFFTRGLATLGALMMLVAYFKVHISGGWNPLVNGGELAVMYFVSFLVLVKHGAQKWSLERKLLKKEKF
jgi:putative oxidoreductase